MCSLTCDSVGTTHMIQDFPSITAKKLCFYRHIWDGNCRLTIKKRQLTANPRRLFPNHCS